MRASELLDAEQGMELEVIIEDASGLDVALKRMPEVTAENESQASELLARCRSRVSDLEAMRKRVKGPHLERCQAIDTLFADEKKVFAALDKALSKLISDYRTKVREEADRKAREEAARLAEQRRREIENARPLAEAVGVEPEELVPSVTKVAPQVPEPVRTSSGTMNDRRDVVVTIEDPTKIPREFLVPDEAAIKARVKELDKEIMATGEPFDTVVDVVAKALPGVSVKQIWTPVSRRRS